LIKQKSKMTGDYIVAFSNSSGIVWILVILTPVIPSLSYIPGS